MSQINKTLTTKIKDLEAKLSMINKKFCCVDNEVQFVNGFPEPLEPNTIYVNTLDGEINILTGGQTYVYLPDDIPELVTVRVEGTTFLSGGYFGATGAVYAGAGVMNNTLELNTLIPASEPYTDLGYVLTEQSASYAAGATDIVDWILLELRDKNDPKIIKYSKAGLLDVNGVFRDPIDNAVGIQFVDIINDEYFVAIKHRNHFGVMSATAQALSDSADFGNMLYPLWEQDDTHYTFQTDGYRLLTTGKYMVAGFTCISGSYSPYTEVYRGYQALAFGYLPADFNLDGNIDLTEFSFWEGFKNDSVATGLQDNKASDYLYDADTKNNEGIITERIPELHKGWLKQILNNDNFGGMQIPLYHGEPLYVWSEGSVIYRTDSNKLYISSAGVWKEISLI